MSNVEFIGLISYAVGTLVCCFWRHGIIPMILLYVICWVVLTEIRSGFVAFMGFIALLVSGCNAFMYHDKKFSVY